MRPFLTAAWRHLLMLNWPVPADLLEPFVPRGTRLDRFDDVLYASLVGFRFLDTRVLGVPVPGHRDFDEVNLRFYVARELTGGERRRGVVFIREIVPRTAIAFVARHVYGEPYVALPMRHRVDDPARKDPATLRYAWRRAGRWSSISATVSGMPAPLRDGSVEEFITEHYWGYTARRDGGTDEYRVEHPSWNVWHARNARFEGDVEVLYGARFAELLAGPPTSAFVADGSAVRVHRGTRLGG